jgi:hypothetical protein
VSSDGSQHALIVALTNLQRQVGQLPDDAHSVSTLTAPQRRDAHALAGRLQDALGGLMSQLVADMAADGADMVDSGGLPRSYGDGSDT